jgi:rSAM/selenodomain-associated transferase 2
MVSIIIPTYNEEENIAETIRQIKARDTNKLISEIIVSDGQSTDKTMEQASKAGATVLSSPKKGRAAQMNFGACTANEEILYFIHADSIPPENFSSYILNATGNNASSGCFRLSFDYEHWFLKANSWFTKFNVNAVRFGDQSLFVNKNVFKESGGFREDLLMMEDQEIIHRLKKLGKFTVMNAEIITSARKYLDNGIYRMQGIFFRIWLLYYLGYSQEQLLQLHRRLIRKHKL